PDAGIDLDLRAHAGGAVDDAALQRLLRPPPDVLDRHVLLERRDALHRAQPGPLLRRAAVDDARLVEMDMALDQARAGKAPARVVALRVGVQPALDGDDAALVDADVERAVGDAVGQQRVADDEVHVTPPGCSPP